MSNNLPPRPPLSFLERRYRAEQLIMYLHETNNREQVLIQLKNFIIQQSTGEVMCMDLGFQLWNSSFTVAILLQEVLAVYPKFLDSTLTMKECTRICHVLTVFRCMASHPDARRGLIKANIPYYFYPFLDIFTNVMRPLQLLRLNIFGLIAGLSKFDELYEQEILLLLLDTQVFPLCLHCICHGDLLVRKAATLILMKILMQEDGLKYCCALPERFISVINVLCQLVQTFTSEIPSSQHLKYVVQCYLCLSRVAWAGGLFHTLRTNFPLQLIDSTFHNIIRRDPEIPIMLHQLVLNLAIRPPQ